MSADTRTLSSAQWLDALVARLGRKFVIGVPMLFLLAVFALPFLVVFKISVSESDGVRFVDLLTWADGILQLKVRFSNYLYILFEDALYLEAYLSSIKYAALTTVICLAIGYPFAYFLARSPADIRPGLLMLVQHVHIQAQASYGFKAIAESTGLQQVIDSVELARNELVDRIRPCTWQSDGTVQLRLNPQHGRLNR